MNKVSTNLLRAVIYIIGVLVLAACLIALPAGILSDQTDYYRPILISLYVPAVPFFYALYQGLQLLNLIDENRAFSKRSVQALSNIKVCGLLISALFSL